MAEAIEVQRLTIDDYLALVNSETLTAAGAASTQLSVTNIDSASSFTITVADGNIGQIKIFNNKGAGTTLIDTANGDNVSLVGAGKVGIFKFNGTSWELLFQTTSTTSLTLSGTLAVTGATTLTGTTTLASTLFLSGTETKTTTGALSILLATSLVNNTTATVINYTLADGAVGQLKIVEALSTSTGAAKITPANGQSVVLSGLGASVVYRFDGTNWNVVSLTTKAIKTIAAINATATATALEVAGGYITSTSGAATTITLPTGTLLGAQLGAVQGTTHKLIIDNTAGSNTVTVAVAVNGILSALAAAEAGGAGLLTVPSGVTGQAEFTLMFSSATAYTFTRTA